MISNEWRVSVSAVGDSIHVICGRSLIYSPTDSEYVKPPTWWERIICITHEMKVDKACLRVQAACDRKNAEELKTNDIVHKKAGIHS